MNIFLDDIRHPSNAFIGSVNLIDHSGIDDWLLIRDYAQFSLVLTQFGLPKTVSFDHDLHFEHIRYFHEHTMQTGYIEYDSFKNKTGWHCAKLLVQLCKAHTVPLPKCYVHSANPVGKENILKLLQYDQQNFL
jgi:hypothetical protein